MTCLSFHFFDLDISEFRFGEMTNSVDGEQLFVTRPQMALERVASLEGGAAIGARERRLAGVPAQVLLANGKMETV